MSDSDTLESLWQQLCVQSTAATIGSVASDDVSTPETRTTRVRCDTCGRPTIACPCVHLPPTPLDTHGALIVLTHPNERRRSLATGWMLPVTYERCAVITKRTPPKEFLAMFANDGDDGASSSPSVSNETKLPPDVPIYLLYPATHAEAVIDVCPRVDRETYRKRLGWNASDASATIPPDEKKYETQTLTSPLPPTRKENELRDAFRAMRGAKYVLIALDSTWRQAREMATASVPLLPKRTKLVKLPAANARAPGLRRVNELGIHSSSDELDENKSDSPSQTLRVEPEPGCMLTAEACARAMEVLEGNFVCGEGGREMAGDKKIIGKSLLPNVVAALRAMASCQSKHDPAMQSGCDKKLSEGKYRQRIAGARALGHEG